MNKEIRTIENTLPSSTLIQLTSSWTLGLRIFFPTVILTFLGALTASIFLFKESEYVGIFAHPFAKYGLLVLWLGLAALMAISVLRLKRLDADDQAMYVSTYLRNFRYLHQDIEKLEISEFWIFDIGRLHFKGKTSLGNSVICILSKKRLEIFLEKYPSVEWPVVEK